ncbi:MULTISPECIES: hypothetical protein [Aminobacterium]|jgi:hypothetical protein|uniref:Uncharacterized protein n=1 Tax=Aminobacterium colombiense (strain DSM 12261 / ALA-1) TaxID=572547 RepID=D5EHA0_AMICL|nr:MULTISPECIES: hypothetical protein [Aminobacterium]MDD2379290.1 hypothetical protein [Aminobacterium colombiense]ADE57932.1 hypothetical protein Amico_1819 [Aminobacterium colombiense DSM 12261]MDD3768417.1 hypothetical protein [Aminobacterium colombiense]MDD4585180.1 hypothetical protein [Aminobacterium colombiense]NLK31098.1 hypothetical protein [Aminobacterium colombiense]
MESWQVVRDRILLYVRAMDLPPFKGLELALDALKQSEASSIEEAMDALESCIVKQKIDLGVRNAKGEHISSVPPMTRGTMVSKNFDRTPWLTALNKFILRWARNLFGPSRSR